MFRSSLGVPSCEAQVTKPPPKRRRILDPSAIVPVPVYSNKVKSSLQLKPTAALLTEKTNADDDAGDSLLSEFSSRGKTADLVSLSDSEDEYVQKAEKELEAPRCPSPPPPESPVKKQSRKVKQKLSEIDRKLRAVNSLLSQSPSEEGRRSRRRRGPPIRHPEEEQLDNDDDIIIVSPAPEPESSAYSSSVREIPLKVRCRTEVHKLPVLSSTPLSEVVTQLSVILNVPPPRLLLLREEEELPTSFTVSELGLGIADIIECVVMAAEDRSQSNDGSGVITVKLQSKDRHSPQEFSLHREAPLRSIFAQYVSKMSGSHQQTVRFHFDGSKVTGSQTPAQLDMEDGDIIEVWV
ncbi:NFATC2-interacting protein isoform X1 [Archocentrus centrarchus]|uniref:NFATC2-interacting protein isoform X1 n=1 Tax=Archocentrus centrarchus TaxID=63155 RepID=UPI0011EA1A07|nr:NFATC2-interacting protein isoform X1 [Archocentrus centrarchus]